MINLCDRLFDFSVSCLKYIKTLPENTSNKVIKYQLAKSASSAGANYEESQAGSSRADFTNKVRISLREMRESNYWLRILKALESEYNPELEKLIIESTELKKILGAIVQKSTDKKT